MARVVLLRFWADISTIVTYLYNMLSCKDEKHAVSMALAKKT